MKEVVFNSGKCISPIDDADWCAKNQESLYWAARRKFPASEMLDIKMTIAADRHYEIFINHDLADKQWNAFNGKQWLPCRQFGNQIGGNLVSGDNEICIVIRSDPWENKNHQALRPFLQADIAVETSDEMLDLSTGLDWELAVIRNWRGLLHLGGCGTIAHEQINAVQEDEAVYSGFAPISDWQSPCLIELKNPRFVLDTVEPIKRNQCSVDAAVIKGVCILPNQQLKITSGDFSTVTSKEPRSVEITGILTLNEPVELSIASSVLVEHEIIINGDKKIAHFDTLNRHQMAFSDYAVYRGTFALPSGKFELRLKIGRLSKGPDGFLLCLTGIPVEKLVESMRSTSEFTAEIIEISNKAQSITGMSVRNGGSNQTGTDAPFIFEHNHGVPQAVVLDAGGLWDADLELAIEAASPGIVNVAYGFNLVNGTIDCARMNLNTVDVIRVASGKTKYRSFERRTFRYLLLLLEGFEGEVSIQSPKLSEPVFLEDRGIIFRCSERELIKIWNASVRNVELCVKELFVDNPERERAQWHDPLLNLASAGYYVFGHDTGSRIKNVYDAFALAQQKDGQIPGYCPGKWFPRIPLQCHMTLFAVGAYYGYLHTGDREFGESSLKTVLAIIDHWDTHRSSDGLVRDLHTVFVDWGSHIYSYGKGSTGPTGALCTFNSFYAYALRLAGKLAGFLDYHLEAAELQQKAVETLTSIRDKMFIEDLGLYRDGIENDLAWSNLSQTANAAAVLAGASPEEEGRTVLRNCFNRQKYPDMIPSNALVVWHVLHALFSAHCDDLAFRWLKDTFGHMPDEGPGTLWETVQRHSSQCQGTGSGPVHILSRYAAGIFPMEPGYRKIGIDLHPGDLTSFSCSLPTVKGNIDVDWKRRNGQIDYVLKLPEELAAKEVVNVSKNEELNLTVK